MNYIIEPLTTAHDRSLFDCGEESLNVFLKQFARQNDARGLGRTYVAGLPDETRILGYYTLSSGSIAVEQMPEKLPRYPVPVAHLGRLAVDLEARRDGLGSLLLIDALRRVTKVAEQLGIYAVEVYALTDEARNFYLRYGFTELLDDQLHMYLSIKNIRRLEIPE